MRHASEDRYCSSSLRSAACSLGKCKDCSCSSVTGSASKHLQPRIDTKMYTAARLALGGSPQASLVIFGEMHGTEQAPSFVGQLACALAARGERVLVAVEHPSTQNATIQRAWKRSNIQFIRELGTAGWSGLEDGNGSASRFKLLVRLHSLARSGQLIDVVAFNGAKDEAQTRRFSNLPGQGQHEAIQAENIRIATAARPYTHVLILTGNVHARKRIVEHSGAIFKPMAMQLASDAEVITLNMATAGGTAWNCQLKTDCKPGPNTPITSSAMVCGSLPIQGKADLHRAPFIALMASPGADLDPDYNGVFWLGKVSASPPVMP